MKYRNLAGEPSAVFRLGIIGSDNSHAEAFSRLTNLASSEPRIEDARVTHIYGTDPERTKEVATKCEIPNIVTRSEEMLGNVDGVLCVWRHASKHMPDTLPFIKAGIPAFVDKPLAHTVADARQLIDTALTSKVGFTSFSTLRYCKPTVDWIASLPGAVEKPVTGMSAGPAEIDSEYDGLPFYGVHTVEMMLATFGYGVESVTAVEQNKNVMATCRYKSGPVVTLNFLYHAAYVFHVTVYGTKGYSSHAVDSGDSYYQGMKVIMETLRTGKWPLTPEQLLEPVQVLSATLKSLAEKREVALSEV
ncbi:MAG TPA: Gfo/Idh/MocA family oxidoreductase [Candidatus Hydrogenedentes bacterium]|nr:Gfo/Idh/MocA family oxidoreductase [Candidatus Hydrogenedentota bacterium]